MLIEYDFCEINWSQQEEKRLNKCESLESEVITNSYWGKFIDMRFYLKKTLSHPTMWAQWAKAHPTMVSLFSRELKGQEANSGLIKKLSG